MALPAIFSGLARDPLQSTQPDVAPRLRLITVQVEHGRGAMSQATVECEGPMEGQRTIGIQKGSTSPGGDLRLAALATLDAVMQATCGALRLEFIGVKSVRAFDTNLIVVAVIAHFEGKAIRVVGSAIAADDEPMTTARATMHALNRLATPLLSRLID